MIWSIKSRSLLQFSIKMDYFCKNHHFLPPRPMQLNSANDVVIRPIIPIKSRRLASLSLCKGSEPMTSLSIVTPQISLKSSSAVQTRRTYTICASQKSPILIRRLFTFRNFTSRFRMSVDNGSSNRSGDRIGAGDAVIIVDHGSRRRESNLMLNEFVAMFRDKTGYPIVEPAHMELAEPSIRDSFASCVEQGAKRIIVSPFFLFPGRHWQQDIPSLTAEAAKDHPGISYIITAPLGLHEKLVDVVNDRISHCLSHAAGGAEECEVCAGTGKCRFN